MKTFKSLDLAIQVLLLGLMIVAYLLNDPEKLNPMLLILAYAIMQIISIIANLSAGPQPWKKTSLRKFHLIGTALVLAMLVVALMQDSSGRTGDKDDKYSMPGLGTLVFATIPAILLALFYTVITGVEWQQMKKKK
jgi:hypothetical protein